MAKPKLDGAKILAQAEAARKGVAVADQEGYSASAVNLRKSDWKFLRRVAEGRAEKQGGRPSVSKVVESLIDANRKQLESELK